MAVQMNVWVNLLKMYCLNLQNIIFKFFSFRLSLLSIFIIDSSWCHCFLHSIQLKYLSLGPSLEAFDDCKIYYHLKEYYKKYFALDLVLFKRFIFCFVIFSLCYFICKYFPILENSFFFECIFDNLIVEF